MRSTYKVTMSASDFSKAIETQSLPLESLIARSAPLLIISPICLERNVNEIHIQVQSITLSDRLQWLFEKELFPQRLVNLS